MIKGAPYNPRKISDESRRRLKGNINRVGLLEPIIWNCTTGNVVGGHQRLKILDQLEGTHDYLVPVAAVELSEKDEKAQNIFLNNGEAQGEWDLEILGDLLKEFPDPDLTGFDNADLFQIFGFSKKLNGSREEDISSLGPTEPDAKSDDQEWDRREKQSADREQGDFFLVVVFGSDDERLEFLNDCDLPDNRYVDGKRLRKLLIGGDDE